MTAPRILVADDNPLSLRFLADALVGAGAEVGEAIDGLAAVRLAAATAYDLLLLDARMPGLDGASALERIRSQGASQWATALATTADDGAASAAALRARGFIAVLTKPLSVDALRDAVASHLPAGVAFAAAPAPAAVAEGSARDGAYVDGAYVDGACVDGAYVDSAHARSTDADALDDEQALRAAGGDRQIVSALRGLFIAELDALPDEIEAFAARGDRASLRDRLHRLDASAGFCGVPALVAAASRLRRLLDQAPWPEQGVAQFLATCEGARRRLSA
ncbi:response regulator [Dokdonella sp.]|uniref:response regulator n=1 Tax=Dokdonella sp. TaxID=2291710 RepID=UPI002F4259A7